MFNHILIPTDGSELSAKAVTAGIALAKTLKARLTALHVYPPRFTVYYGEIGWVDDRLEAAGRETAVREGNKFLADIAAAAASADVPCEGVLLANENPWRAIIETAERQRCGLIVMAAHGRRGLSALVLGSETNKVLTHSRIPVLVYR